MLRFGRGQAGDTLIEVLLAFAIFGAAAVVVTRTMNDGFTRLFVSTQQSQINAIMQGQQALLQAAHDEKAEHSGATHWDAIIANVSDGPVNADGCTYSANKKRLYFPMSGSDWLTVSTKDTGLQAVGVVPANSETPTNADGDSIWIEAQYTAPDPATKRRGYYDFYIKACWQDASVSVPRQLKTVLRLYDLVPVETGFVQPVLRRQWLS